MPSDRERRIEEIFLEAAELTPPERPALLDARCAGDPALRDAVETMLDHLEAGEKRFERPAARLAPEHLHLDDPERIGPYRVLQRLGVGGFGVVYEVEQTEPLRRRLALKVLKAGMDTEGVLARFAAERQTLALMEHPGIAKVIDAGCTEQGRPYFAMELVKGEPLTEYCDRARLDLSGRLALFLEVCRAVQHAHQRGVIHRDLKPHNILVTLVDGRPVPKVIDFGVAKATAAPLHSAHTLQGQILGTPAYMAPEQAESTGLDVDITADVYGLGAVLYELLCGRRAFPPDLFEGVAAVGVPEILRRHEPPRPSAAFRPADEDASRRAARRGGDPVQVAGRIRGDLDWIVARTLEKDRTRRYQTVLDLIQDLRRHRDHEPVQASPPSVAYRASKFARRHRVGLAFAGSLALVLVVAGAALSLSLLESRRQRAAAERARSESDAVVDFLGGMLAEVSPLQAGKDVAMREVLEQAAADVDEDFADQPLVEARLRHVMGVSFRELGEHDRAREHLDRAVHLRSRELGGEDPRTLASLRERAVLHEYEGEWATAETLMVRLRSARTRLLGPDHPEALESLDDLGALYLYEERNEEALPLLEESVGRAQRTLGPEHPFTTRTTQNLGIVLNALGRFDEAEPILAACLRRDLARRGFDHPEVIASQQNLGSLYRELGRYDEADSLYRASYAAGRRVWGDEHPLTLRLHHNLALLLNQRGRHEEALEHTRAVVADRLRLQGEKHPGTLMSRLNLSQIYIDLGRYGESVKEAESLRPLLAEVHGEDHLYVLILDSGLGRALLEWGRPERAEAVLSAAAERALRDFPDHWRTGIVLANLGECLDRLGRREEAEARLLDAWRLLEAAFGPEHDRAREVAGTLARHYEDAGRGDEAAAWALRAGG